MCTAHFCQRFFYTVVGALGIGIDFFGIIIGTFYNKIYIKPITIKNVLRALSTIVDRQRLRRPPLNGPPRHTYLRWPVMHRKYHLNALSSNMVKHPFSISWCWNTNLIVICGLAHNTYSQYHALACEEQIVHSVLMLCSSGTRYHEWLGCVKAEKNLSKKIDWLLLW